MVYRIIQLHNGSIDFSSEVNRGTTFRISLPR
jgi:signal transduction histidine kinase